MLNSFTTVLKFFPISPLLPVEFQPRPFIGVNIHWLIDIFHYCNTVLGCKAIMKPPCTSKNTVHAYSQLIRFHTAGRRAIFIASVSLNDATVSVGDGGLTILDC